MSAAANPYPVEDTDATAPLHRWSELRTTGLLWLINTTVLHPRGFALAMSYPEGTTREQKDSGEVESDGWLLVGDGSEPWVFQDAPDESWTIDSCFRRVNALLRVGGEE